MKRTDDDRARRTQLAAGAAGITVAVYTVNPETGEQRTVREETGLPAGSLTDVLSLSSGWPLCECPQAPACRKRRVGR